MDTPNLPTKNLPAKTAWLKLSGKFPMDMRIPPLTIKILLHPGPTEPVASLHEDQGEAPAESRRFG